MATILFLHKNYFLKMDQQMLNLLKIIKKHMENNYKQVALP